MALTEKLTDFSRRIGKIKGNISTEEATKTSMILPFFQILGYDVFDPCEFVPEYTADVGTKKGEKVDYAIFINGEPLILVEAKSANVELAQKHAGQLMRYFSVTNAKFGILTNGVVYQFYSDLEEPNKMDSVPFLEFDIFNIKKEMIKELEHFQKSEFNTKSILDSASDLKYMTTIKNIIAEQFREPSDQFVRAIINKRVYSGAKTKVILDKFRLIIHKAFDAYISDVISERISNVISIDTVSADAANDKEVPVITAEEKEVLDLVKEILKNESSIEYRKTSRYAYMQLGKLSTKWICRVYIRKEKHLFVLHKFDDTDYECEYYFDEVEQLEMIKELIKDTFEKCCKS